MLVVERHVMETVVIAPGTPHETTVFVLALKSGKVRLGFHAAPEVIINRSEVQDRLDREKEAAGVIDHAS